MADSVSAPEGFRFGDPEQMDRFKKKIQTNNTIQAAFQRAEQKRAPPILFPPPPPPPPLIETAPSPAPTDDSLDSAIASLPESAVSGGGVRRPKLPSPPKARPQTKENFPLTVDGLRSFLQRKIAHQICVAKISVDITDPELIKHFKSFASVLLKLEDGEYPATIEGVQKFHEDVRDGLKITRGAMESPGDVRQVSAISLSMGRTCGQLLRRIERGWTVTPPPTAAKKEGGGFLNLPTEDSIDADDPPPSPGSPVKMEGNTSLVRAIAEENIKLAKKKTALRSFELRREEARREIERQKRVYDAEHAKKVHEITALEKNIAELRELHRVYAETKVGIERAIKRARTSERV